ncbi:DUF7426 family protein [Arthrobacter russicus]|uniref:DUF7426 family protein n=1 Tax=Arthrobacter russicus TaxID=172040 RepID=UPI00264D89C9|nr:hypothetical protein [Arthrobacter russicus]MDN5667040.1 hypothetical protein [Renibacterium salmoninarum]
MAFRSLEEINGPIVLPIRGKEYTLPVVSLNDGLKLHSILSGENQDELFEELYRILLGDAWHQMTDDKVPAPIIDRVFYTALADFRTGREAAEDIWENGLPKGYSEIAAAAVQKAMTLQGAEPTTPQPDSTNGTNAKSKPAPGKKSSNTGH